jgi:hypothetical protein
MRAARIESVESDQVTSSGSKDVTSDHWLMRYSCSIESTHFDNVWKTAANLHVEE